MEITSEIINQYRQGNCTPEQQEAVEAWLTEQRNTFQQRPFPFHGEEHALGVEIWDRLEQQLISESDLITVQITSKHRIGKTWLRAASIILVCGLSMMAYWWCSSETKKALYTNNGKKSTFTLVDGSTITLNGGSSLHLNDDFNKLRREVTLSGEAFFDVKTDPSKPFIVKTASSTVVVLGTSFNLKAYPKEQQILAVKSGRVQFTSAQQKAAILHAGELLKEQEAKIRSAVQINDYLSWREDCLLFEDQPLNMVAKTLERQYGMPIKNTIKQSGNIRLTGKFTHFSLDEMLESLSYTLNIHYKKEKDHVVLF